MDADTPAFISLLLSFSFGRTLPLMNDELGLQLGSTAKGERLHFSGTDLIDAVLRVGQAGVL